MNVLLIVADTVRAGYCGCYGNPWVRTPNIDALAERGTLFERFYAASFPTGPMRQDLHSGRFTFPYMPWANQWSHGETRLGPLLRSAGYHTAMIGDTPSNGWHKPDFEEFTLIEGQGHDLNPDGPEMPLPADLRKLRGPMPRIQKLLRNAAIRRGEEDCCAAQTMRDAHNWLASRWRQQQPFFLMVDTFDPHEPWDPPRAYIDRYDPGYQGDELFEPAYEPAEYASSEEIRHMRCMYAGELTMVDRWIGHLLDVVDRMKLWDETVVVFTSDHGFYHGEHGLIGKVQLTRDNVICHRWALYETIARAPLIIGAPGIPPEQRVSAFAQPPDIMPTICDLVGAPIPQGRQGMSLVPVMKGMRSETRDLAITSHTYVQDDEVRCPTSVRTEDHLYIYGGDEWESALYDLSSDPGQERNIITERMDVAARLHGRYLAFLRQIDCPPERLAGREAFMLEPRGNLPPRRLI
jgi:arylsulfatase A-like enzyme